MSNLYATTLEVTPACMATRLATTPQQEQDSPDSRQLRGTARDAFTHKRIVRHAFELLSPWPIKGGAAPQPQGTDTETNDAHSHAFRLHLDIGTCLNQYLWDLEDQPPLVPRL
jgi:hypothetical protein